MELVERGELLLLNLLVRLTCNLFSMKKLFTSLYVISVIIGIYLIFPISNNVQSQGKLIPSYMGLTGLTNVLGNYYIKSGDGLGVGTNTTFYGTLFVTNVTASASSTLSIKVPPSSGFGALTFDIESTPKFFFQYDGSADELSLRNAAGTKLLRLFQAQTNSIPTILFTPTASKTVTNTLSETTLIPTSGIGAIGLNKSFPANFWTAGKQVTIKLNGNYHSGANPELAFKGSFGGNTITTGSNGITQDQVAARIDIDMQITCYTTGVSGTFVINLYSRGTTWAYGASSFFELTANTTAATAFDITSQAVETTTSVRIQNVEIRSSN